MLSRLEKERFCPFRKWGHKIAHVTRNQFRFLYNLQHGKMFFFFFSVYYHFIYWFHFIILQFRPTLTLIAKTRHITYTGVNHLHSYRISGERNSTWTASSHKPQLCGTDSQMNTFSISPILTTSILWLTVIFPTYSHK